MKHLLLILVLGTMTLHCASHKKSEQELERARIEKEYNIPRFNDANAQELAYNFAVFLDGIKKSIENGEELDSASIQSKALSFLDENKTKGESLSFEDTQKLTNWTLEMLKEFIN